MNFSEEELNALTDLVKEQFDGNKFFLAGQAASYRRIRKWSDFISEEYATDHLARIKAKVEFWETLLVKLSEAQKDESQK